MDKPAEHISSDPSRFLPKNHLTVAFQAGGKWSIGYADLLTPSSPSLVDFMRKQDEGRNGYYDKLQEKEFNKDRSVQSDFYDLVDHTNFVDPCSFALFIDVLTRKILLESDKSLRRKLIRISAKKLKVFADENIKKSIVIPASAYEALQSILDTKTRKETPDLEKFSAAISIALHFVYLDKTFASPSKEDPCGAVFDHIVDATMRRINEHTADDEKFSVSTCRDLTNTIALLVDEAYDNPKLVTQQYKRLLWRLADMKETYGDIYFKGDNIIQIAKFGLSAMPLRNANGAVISKAAWVGKIRKYISGASKKFKKAMAEMTNHQKPTQPQPTAQNNGPKHTPT